jgi:hypothetical protein
MSSILYIIYENTETTPTTYYPEVYSRADIDIDQIASIINEAHQTIDVALAKVTLLEMAKVISLELSSGYWVSFSDFMTFQTEINAESEDTEIYIDEDDLEVIGYVYNDFTDAVESAATFELLKYGFPREPWILTAIETKYNLPDHVVDNHGLIITGEDFVVDKSDSEQGVWIKSPAGNNYRQNKYTYVSDGEIIITAELSGENGPAGKNSVEVELSIRASYDDGSTISTGTYGNKLRRVNQISDTENKVFLTGSQTTCGVELLNFSYQQYEEIILYASTAETGVDISLYEGDSLQDTVNVTENSSFLLYGTGAVELNVTDYSILLSNLSVGITEIAQLNEEPWTPAQLNLNLWLEATDSSTITESGGYISQWADKSGNNNHAIQGDSNLQPQYIDNTVVFGNQDKLITDLPATTGTRVVGTIDATISYGIDISSGDFSIGTNSVLFEYTFDDIFIHDIISDSPLSNLDIEKIYLYMTSRGSGPSGDNAFENVTDFTYYWAFADWITSFPIINTSNATSLASAWGYCSGLTSFPILDTSSCLNFEGSWWECTNLTSFPILNTSKGTNFAGAWYNCNSLTDFPLIDTSDGIIFAGTWYNCGLTSFPTLNMSKGINFSSAWENNNLVSFPANMFDNLSSPANFCFTGAFAYNVIDARGMENILVSIDTSGANAPSTGVDITISSNGDSLTPATNTAITNLKGKGWTITIDGVPK